MTYEDGYKQALKDVDKAIRRGRDKHMPDAVGMYNHIVAELHLLTPSAKEEKKPMFTQHDLNQLRVIFGEDALITFQTEGGISI